MMTENEFNALAESARQYKYSSMSYIDFGDCKNARILRHCSDLILLQDESTAPSMLYFATDNFSLVLDAIVKIPGELKIHFVPREFAKPLENLGFAEWGEYFDFFNTNLSGTVTNSTAAAFLKQSECEAAAEISQKCRLQSRGFEGETAEWFAQWLTENSVIIQREGSKIVGFCCVSIYNEGTTLWIREIAVDPAYQGMGFGKKLMAQAIAYGIENGASKGFLHADVLNKNAIVLYEKYNFHSKYEGGELQMIRRKPQ